MIDGRWGRVINITGKSEPEGVNGAYCAKAALTAWSKGLSREVGRHGITVNCIPPGRILSEQILRNYTPEYRALQSEHEIPMGRYGEPEELADLAVFLASPRAGYITGAVIPGRRRIAPLPVLSAGNTPRGGRGAQPVGRFSNASKTTCTSA